MEWIDLTVPGLQGMGVLSNSHDTSSKTTADISRCPQYTDAGLLLQCWAFPGFGNILARGCDTTSNPARPPGETPGITGFLRQPADQVGVIATLSLLASVSPLIWWIIKVPAPSTIIFNFPDTNFAGPSGVGIAGCRVNGTQTHCLVGLGWQYGPGCRVNAAEIAAGATLLSELSGRISDSPHVVAIVVLVLGREFWAASAGALLAVVWLAGAWWSESWRLGVWSNHFRSLAPDERLRGQPGGWIRLADPDLIHRQTHVSPQRDFRCSGVFALIGAAIVPVPISARWTMR